MLRIGVIGAGRLGGFHADKIAARTDVKLVCVYDTDPAAAESLAAKHHCRPYSSLEELWNEVDAVVIATPTRTHGEISLPFVNRGIHVLLEKPMTATAAEAQNLVAAAQKSGAVLQVGHVEQFNPAWVAAEPLLSELRNGKPAVIDMVRTSGYTFRSVDVGAVLDLMIHDLELLLSVVACPIREVRATQFHWVGQREKDGHEDIAKVTISFENGTLATLLASRVEPVARRETRIWTADSSAVIDFATRTFRWFLPDDQVKTGDFAPNSVSPNAVADVAKTMMTSHFTTQETVGDSVDALALELDDFIGAIVQKRQPKVTGARAAEAVQLAETILTKSFPPLSS